jgi:hypothetical protein
MMTIIKTSPLVKIRIDNDVRVGVVSVYGPEANKKYLKSHGLGKVGEPILPYLGHRAEGYSIVIPRDRRDLYVCEVLWYATPGPRGRFPETRLPWSDLEAPDMPELEPFASEEIGARAL